MVLLQLLTFTLLSSYFHPGTAVDTQPQLSITPEIFPQDKVYEGDKLSITCNITCTISLYSSKNTPIYVDLRYRTKTIPDCTMVAQTKNPLDFECRFGIGNGTKNSKQRSSVSELFSSPTLTMNPADVFKGENMSLTCKSESYASERIKEPSYTLELPDDSLTSTETGVFSGKARQHDFNYACVAEAGGIKKRSETLTVRPKEPPAEPPADPALPAPADLPKKTVGKLFRTTANMNNKHSKEHNGTNNSEVTIEGESGHMALWKEAVIGGVCLLVGLALMCVLYKFLMGRGSYSVATRAGYREQTPESV